MFCQFVISIETEKYILQVIGFEINVVFGIYAIKCHVIVQQLFMNLPAFTQIVQLDLCKFV